MEDLFKICGIVNLKKGEGRTIKAGGMWVYDNDIYISSKSSRRYSEQELL